MQQLEPKSPLRIAVMISGSGKTLRNLIDKIARNELDAEIRLIVANTFNAPGLQYGEKGNIPMAVIERGEFPSQAEFSAAIFERCRQASVDTVVLAGFLKRIVVPDDFANRVVNIHPALMPSFCGKGFYGHHIHEAVLQQGVKLSGCTVHFVDNRRDHGPIIIQRTVPVLDNDTPASLGARAIEAECQAYPEALGLLAAGRISIDGRRVHIAPC